jgi:hypothetical protein
VQSIGGGIKPIGTGIFFNFFAKNLYKIPTVEYGARTTTVRKIFSPGFPQTYLLINILTEIKSYGINEYLTIWSGTIGY